MVKMFLRVGLVIVLLSHNLGGCDDSNKDGMEYENRSTTTMTEAEKDEEVLETSQPNILYDLEEVIPTDIKIPDLESMGYHLVPGSYVRTINDGIAAMTFTYSKIRHSEGGEGDPFDMEVLVNVKIGLVSIKNYVYEEFAESVTYYDDAVFLKNKVQSVYAGESAPENNVLSGTVENEATVAYQESAPWELFPDGCETGLCFERTPNSYLHVECFSVSSGDYPWIMESVTSYYEDIVMNHN